MKTTVEIADPLFHLARALAAKEGLTFRVLIEEGLRSAIEARERAADQGFRLRDGSFKGGQGLQPGVRWEGLSALAYEEAPTSFKR